MKKKVLIVLAIVLLGVVAIRVVPRIVNRNVVKPAIEAWVEENNFSGVSIKRVTKDMFDNYYITLKWNDFENLTPSDMKRVINNWRAENRDYEIDRIVSNGTTYYLSEYEIYLYPGYKTVVSLKDYSNYSNSNSSSSAKTATCNYCGGTGRVNGDTCPWCNGSGKTYDNSFNDALK